MLALHCCAIQGRDDAIELLLRYDTQQLQKKDLAMENQVNDFCIIMYMSISACLSPPHFFSSKPP